jgi:hypothetical protein
VLDRIRQSNIVTALETDLVPVGRLDFEEANESVTKFDIFEHAESKRNIVSENSAKSMNIVPVERLGIEEDKVSEKKAKSINLVSVTKLDMSVHADSKRYIMSQSSAKSINLVLVKNLNVKEDILS